MPAAPTERLERALAATRVLVAAVRDDQWDSPTNCSGWTVRGLVNHLVAGSDMFVGVLHGAGPPTPEMIAKLRSADRLGDDAAAAYDRSAAELVAAFGQPDVLDRIYVVPLGRMPGAGMLHLRVTETLVHGWDLARSTGQPAELPSDLAEEELAFARRMITADFARTNRFGSEQPVADDAPAIDRLAAFLGRVVTGDPSAAAN